MGNRYPANEHGIYSASLYCVYGCWLRGLVVLAVTARRLLVGDTREASASSAVWSDHSGPYPYVPAGGLCSSCGLRPLSNFFSALASDLNGRGHRLACKTRLDAERRRCRSLGSDGTNCFRLDTLGSRAVSRQERMAVCPSGQVSAHANAEKRRDRRGMEHWVLTLAILRHALKIALCCQTNTLAKSLATSMRPCTGRVFYVTGPGYFKRSQGACPTFRGSQKLQSIAAIPRERCLQQWREDLLHRTAGRVVCAFSKRLSTTRAARRAVTLRPFGRSLALARRELPGSKAIRA